MANNLKGLCYDKLIYDHLAGLVAGDPRAVMNMSEAEKIIGLPGPMVLRAIRQIRATGYPVISTSTRRTWENDFRIPQNQKDYVEWRTKLMDDIKTLQTVMEVCDAAAKHHFGEFAVQENLFNEDQETQSR